MSPTYQTDARPPNEALRSNDWASFTECEQSDFGGASVRSIASEHCPTVTPSGARALAAHQSLRRRSLSAQSPASAVVRLTPQHPPATVRIPETAPSATRGDAPQWSAGNQFPTLHHRNRRPYQTYWMRPGVPLAITRSILGRSTVPVPQTDS